MSSNSSLRSAGSVETIGLDESTHRESSARLRLIPEGSINLNASLFDAVVLLIYCPTHHNVAVISHTRTRFIWLPFVQQRLGDTWKKAAIEAVDKLIGRQDAELDAESARKQRPKFEVNYLDITRVQMPDESFITRVCQLVVLIPDSEYQCCRNNSKVNWFSLSALVTQHADDMWGPEVRIFCQMLTGEKQPTKRMELNEFTISDSLRFFNRDMEQSQEHKAMLGLGLKVGCCVEVYEDFLRHCYPSLSISINAFRTYLMRFDLISESEPGKIRPANVMRLYQAYQSERAHRRVGCINFSELLLGIVAMDPRCKDKCEARIRLLFRYYSGHKKNFTDEDMSRMINDIQEANGGTISQPAKVLAEFASHVSQISYRVFYQTVWEKPLLVNKLLRFTTSVVQRISPTYANRVVRKGKHDRAKTTEGAYQGELCVACRPKLYDYGMNAVTLNTQGQCVEPMIIDTGWLDSCLYDDFRRYSMECTFAPSSLAPYLLELIKMHFIQRPQARSQDISKRSEAFLAGTIEDRKILLKYLQTLCQHLVGLLISEQKLLRLNASAIVIGDLQGSISDLLTIENRFIKSFPVISDTLLFLGNYTGEYSNGVECALYVMALKVCAPNKIYMLRGHNETRGNSESLKSECLDKYGHDVGFKVFEVMQEAFSHLPIAATLDENILCVNSGIPAGRKSFSDLLKIEGKIADVKQYPLVHQILTRFPVSYEGETSIEPYDYYETITGANPGDLTFHSRSVSISYRKSEHSTKEYEESELDSDQIKSSNIEESQVLDNVEIGKTSGKGEESRIKMSEQVMRQVCFDRQEFREYLTVHNLDFVVRSSSVCRKGFKTNFSDTCLTVFSCSNYTSENQAAVLVVDRFSSRMRFISLSE